MISTKSPLCQTLVVFTAALLFNACHVIGQNRVKGNGHVVKEDRQVGSFHKIKSEGAMDIYVTQGQAKSAVIEADDNIVPLVELVQDGDRLVVRLKRGYDVSSHNPINVYLTTPEIDEASLAGSGNLNFSGKFNAKSDMKFSVSGSGNLKGDVNAPAVKAAIAGSGDIDLRGETKDVNLSIAGSGNFGGDQLMSENVNVSIAGSGNANVYASVKLTAKIAGSGDVNYKGSPSVSSSVAGSGSVNKR
jgi:hypothetical protein